jgi:hypothetical protein
MMHQAMSAAQTNIGSTTTKIAISRLTSERGGAP